MKLLIATGLYPPDIGGPATYTVFLEKHLPEHGISYEVLPYGIVRKYPKIIRHFIYFLKLVRRARRTDMFYALDTVSVGLPVFLASKITHTPYLLRVPGDYAWEQGSQKYGIEGTLDEFLIQKEKKWQVRLLSYIQKIVAQHATHIIVPSDYMKEVVNVWGVPKERITRVYSALKTIAVTETNEVLRKKYNHDGFVVTTAARLVPWKGISTLVGVTVTLRKKGIPISLEIIGDGVCKKDLEEQILRSNAGEFICLRGALSREELAERITASDAFVLNTSYEGLSHQLLEVMSLGTPIVTTPVGGNLELIQKDETGIFIPFNDVDAIENTLMKLFNDRAFGTTLATRAQASIGKFHESVVSKELVTLLQNIWKS